MGVFLPDECWVWRMTARRRGQASLRRLEVTQTQTHAKLMQVATRLEKADQLSLSIGIAFDVVLGRLYRPMAGKLLDITKRPTGLVDEASCLSDEGPPAGMRRASLKADRPIELMEPIDDRFGRHRLTIAFGSDHRSF